MRKFLTICDKLLCLTVMRLLPQSTKDKVSNRMFQPTLTMRFFERIARKCFNHIFIQLNSEEKKQLTKRIWNGEAGSSWIEQKRKRYESNDMQFFIGQVRQTLDDMVLSFLKDNLQYQHILDIGTGSGEICFYLDRMLSSNYRIKGVDINPNAIALNLEKMKTMAAKRLLHFECSDVSSYFKKQQMTDALLVVSVATLKFFTADQLLECLKTMKARSEKISLAICEEMPVRTLRQGHSLYTGNLGFAHDYPTYFTQAGYQLKHVETRSLDGAKSDYQLGYILATAL